MKRSGQLRTVSAALGILAVSLFACKPGEGTGVIEGDQAVAELRDAEGATIGTAKLAETDGGVLVEFEGSDLPPGLHGFHIHETGECVPPSFESAGGHFNPTNKSHGLLSPGGPHIGDMPNLEVEADGSADFSYVVQGANLDRSGERSLLAGAGTALVLHANPNDQITDPAGNAGPRIACGVIKVR